MNRVHRLIWSETLNAWVAVAEIARARGKRARSALTLLSSALLITLSASAAPPVPTQLPTNGQVVLGKLVISQNGTSMEINQSSQRGIVSWDTFNVGSQAQVNFKQPNADAVTLNRVLDSNPSQIFGRVSANGQVFFTNPNGVIFGASASVDVGGLVATSHSISDADFMAGKNSFSRDGAKGSVINEGKLQTALGGYIALLAPEVRNSGVIVAQLGTVALAAGESITLNFDSNNTLAGIVVTPSQINALVENRQAVLAPGGMIILSARAVDHLQGGVINNSGRLEASGLSMKGGKIVLDASKSVENSGVISASAGKGMTTAEGLSLPGGPAGMVSINATAIYNSGVISAAATSVNGGHIVLVANNIVQTASGRLDVSSDTSSVTGTILLNAVQDITLAGSVTAHASSEEMAGTTILPDLLNVANITLKAGHNIRLNNTLLDASGGDSAGRIGIEGGRKQPEQAPDQQPTVFFLGNTVVNVSSRRRSGGSVTVLGDTIAMLDHTQIEASGAIGGGTVFIGGDAHGANPTIPNAQNIFVDSNVSIRADAESTGNGGKIIVWADIATGFKGSISAQGGSLSGNGGWVEVSGKQRLSYAGLVNTLAAHGNTGSLLLDPTDITISTAADTGTMLWSGAAFTDVVTTPSNLNTTTLQNQLALTNVVVDAASGLGGFGDITVSNPVAWATNTLTLQAARNISIDAALTGTGAPIALNAPAGFVNINAAVSAGPNVSIVTPSLTTTASGSITAGAGGSISINADSVSLNISSTLQAPGGTLAIAPFTPGTTIGISGGAGVLSLTAANFASNFVAGFADIMVGDPGTGAITVGGVTNTSDSLTLTSAAAISINAPLSVVNTLTLASLATVSGSGDISASSLWLNGGGPGVNFNLNTATANNVGTLAASGAANVSFVNSGPMTVGTVGPANGIAATGTVSLETLSGNLAVTQNIVTTDTSAAAVYLNAGKTTGAGSAAGGDLVISAAIGTGAGGTATLMTGSVAGSAGVAAAAGAGNYRYNSDEGATNYSTPLGASGTFAIYREQPVISVTANADAKIYNGLAYGGNNGVTYSGFANGETTAVLGGAVTYGGTALGAINAGTYAITPAGLTNGLGYALNYVNGALTVNTATLTVTASSSSKNFGTTKTFAGTEFTSAGLQNGETLGSVSLSSAGSVPLASIAGGPYAIVASAATGGTFNAANYAIVYVDGLLTINQAALIITANSSSKTYGTALSFAGTEYTVSGLLSGETIGSVSLSSAGTGAAAGVAGGPYAIVPSAATGGSFIAGNYIISYVNGALTVNPAALTITANAAGKTYDGLAFTGGNGVLYNGFVNGETNTVLSGVLGYGGTSQNALNAGDYVITPSGLGSANYQLNYVGGKLTVSKAALMVTANDASKTYNGIPYVGGNDVSYGGFVHGETAAVLGGVLDYAGSSQGSINVGKYAITPLGLSSGNYAISYVDGMLTINVLPPVILPPTTLPLPTSSPIPNNVLTAGPEVLATKTSLDNPLVDPAGAPATLEPNVLVAEQATKNVVPESVPTTPAQSAIVPVDEQLVGSTASGNEDIAPDPAKKSTGKIKSAIKTKPSIGTGQTATKLALEVEPATLTVSPANAKSSAKSQDFLPGSRVQAAIAAGLDPVQAERAGNAFSAAVVRQMSQGIPMDEAIARAELVFKVVSNFSAPSSPQETAIKNLAAIGDNTPNQPPTLDALTAARVQAAVATGLNPAEAERAGNAYSATVVRQLSKGASMSEAIAHAEQVFSVVANFSSSSTPQVAALKNLAAGSNNAASQLTAVTESQTATGSATFNKVVTSGLAKGMSMAQSIQSAQTAARQVDALVKADNSPQSALANGKNGSEQLANRPAVFQKTLGELLSKGYTLEQGMQRAAQIAENEMAAVRADASNPAVSLASGKLSALPARTASGSADKSIAAALARGLSIGDALKRAQQIDAAEQRAVEADARNPVAVFSNGRAAPATNNADFERALGNAIARGEAPDVAFASAQRATAKISPVKPTTITALASGEDVAASLLGAGTSRTYRTVLGNALAHGKSVEQASAMATLAEQKNALHIGLPASVLRKISFGANKLSLSITTSGGRPLPAWLKFSPESREFIANEVPDGALPMQVVMHVGNQNYIVDISEGAVLR